MKRIHLLNVIAISIIAGILFSCAADSSHAEYEKTAAPNIGGANMDKAFKDEMPATEEQKLSDSVASATNVYKPMATGKLNDTNFLFMRNADMRCSVKDVRKATFSIEDIVRKYDGFVTYTNLSGHKSFYSSTRVAKDSIAEHYKVSIYNEITLRIPNEKLDSALIEMNELITFIDNRTIRAEDVKLKMLALSLKQKRDSKHLSNIQSAVNTQGKKLDHTVDALDAMDRAATSRDEQQLSMLEMKDKVDYSTVNLYVYQPEFSEFKTVFVPATPEPYSPSFGDRMESAGKTSIVILQYLVMFVVLLLPFVLVFILVWILIRWLIRTKLLSRLFRI